MFFELLKLSDEFGRLCVAKQLLVPHDFGTVSNLVLLVLMAILHLALVLLCKVVDLLIKLMPDVVKLGQLFQLLAALNIALQDFRKHVLGAVNLGIYEFLVNVFITIVSFVGGYLAFKVTQGIPVLDMCILAHLVIDKRIIEVLQIFKHLNCV